MEAQVRIGTSGFAYRDWLGAFYPGDTTRTEWLAHYARRLAAVELGSTFHRVPSVDEARTWAANLPPSFRLCLTAPRALTRHAKEGRPGALSGLLAAEEALGARAGPVLVQLPHGATDDPSSLARFLDQFEGLRLAVEPRRDDPLTDALLRTLSARGAALVVTDDVVGLPRLEVTSSFAYLRLRRVAGEREWEQWAERIALLGARGLEVYAFLRQGRREPAALRAEWLAGRVRERLRRLDEAASALSPSP